MIKIYKYFESLYKLIKRATQHKNCNRTLNTKGNTNPYYYSYAIALILFISKPVFAEKLWKFTHQTIGSKIKPNPKKTRKKKEKKKKIKPNHSKT